MPPTALVSQRVGPGQAVQAEGAPWEWPVRRYFAVMAVLGVLSALVLGLGLALGNPKVAVIVLAFPVGLLVLWKPDFGLYLLVLYLPFEQFGVVPGVTTLTRILGIYTLACLVLHLVVRRTFELRPAGFWLALAFATWSMFTTFGAVLMPDVVWWETTRRFQMVGLLFLALNICITPERARTLYWAMFLAAVLGAIGAFILPVGPEQVAGGGRATLGAQDANYHARDLFPGLLLAPFIWSQVRSRWLRLLVLLGVLIVAVEVVATGSRSGSIAAFAGVLVVMLTHRGAPLMRRIGLAAGAAILVAVFVLVGIQSGLWAGGLWERVAELREEGLGAGGRLDYWRVGIEQGLRRPFLGVGIGHSILMSGYLPEIIVMHNDFITHFAETGAPGLLLYVGFLGATFWRAWRTGIPWLRAGVVGLFAAGVLSSMANPAFGHKTFWLFMAAGLVAGTVFPHRQTQGALGAGAAAASAGFAGGGYWSARPPARRPGDLRTF